MAVSETVGRAVEQTNGHLKMLDESRWADVLPAHIGPAKFQRWALGIMQDRDMIEVAKTPAGQLSIVTALLDCASLGLEPGRTYHLVRFGGQVTGITDYKGEIELITNANPAAVVCAMLVRERDDFYMVGANVPPKHDADWFGYRGPIVGGYAYADYGGHYSQVVRMRDRADPADPGIDSFEHHRAKARTKNVWDEWPESMRLKTLIHQLRKWVAWSPEVTRRG
jgi:recombination protein RecT